MHTDTEAESVKIRQECEHSVSSAEEVRYEIFSTEGLRIKVKIREDYALWLAGGATRVENDSGVVGIHAGVRVAYVFMGEAYELIPAYNLLCRSDVILAAFSQSVDSADKEVHRTSSGDHDDFFE